MLEFVIISYEVRLAVSVEKKVCNEDLLGQGLLFGMKIIARENAPYDVLAVVLEPSDDCRIKRLHAENTLVVIKDRSDGFAGLKERAVGLDLDYERDLAVNEF